jgi:protein-S-isoprenylcysteine O-methyltransferase Ste14
VTVPNVLSLVAPVVLVASLVFLGATGNLVSRSPVAIALQLGAVALAVWARTAFPAGAFRVAAEPAAERVIRRGPYRVIRHPQFAAALLFLWTAVLFHRSPVTLGVGTVATLAAALRIVIEERMLRARYPEYAGYARTTKAIVPFVL